MPITIKDTWIGWVAAALVGAILAYWWCTRPNPETQATIRRADSVVARWEKDSLTIERLRKELQEEKSRAQIKVVAATGGKKKAQEVHETPVEPPTSTPTDSIRYWQELATRNEEAYQLADQATDDALEGAAILTTAIEKADSTINSLKEDKGKLVSLIDTQATLLKKTRGCGKFCPGVILGYGYSLEGHRTFFAGVGIRVNPLHILKQLVH